MAWVVPEVLFGPSVTGSEHEFEASEPCPASGRFSDSFKR